jgi:hypothetical protein
VVVVYLHWRGAHASIQEDTQRLWTTTASFRRPSSTGPPTAEPPFSKKQNILAPAAAGSNASATGSVNPPPPSAASKKKNGKRGKNKFARDKVSIASLVHFPTLSKKDAAAGSRTADSDVSVATATKVKSPTKRYSDVLLKTPAPAKSLRAESATASTECTPVVAAALPGQSKNNTLAANSVPSTAARDTTECEQNGKAKA